MTRRVRIAAMALTIGAIVMGTSSVAASVPTAQQRMVWQHVCENGAKGALSDQEALVCVHEGFPVWSDGALTVLRRVCEGALGGTYVRRSSWQPASSTDRDAAGSCRPIEVSPHPTNVHQMRVVSPGSAVGR